MGIGAGRCACREPVSLSWTTAAMGELEATVQLDAPLEQTSIMTRTYNVHYSGHILVTSVNGWQSVGDLRSHIAALVGVPAYNIQLFVMGCGQGQFRVIECKHLNSDE